MSDQAEKMGSERLPVTAKGQKMGAPARTFPGLDGVSVVVTLVLGRTELTIDEAADLTEKSLVRIDRRADDPVDVCVNGQVVARGKLVVVGDNYGVEITELVGAS